MEYALRHLASLIFLAAVSSCATAKTPVRADAATTTATTRSATHCRIGYEYKKDGSKAKLKWEIVPITDIGQLAAAADHHFQIIQEFFSDIVAKPSLRIMVNELLFTVKNGNVLDLSHGQGDPLKPTLISHGTLTLEPNEKLWLSGFAHLNTAPSKKVGEFYAYLREDRAVCEHKNVKIDTATGKKPPCHRVLIEYFDDTDTHSINDRPQLGVNVFKLGEGECTGSLQETNDGEGDEGPN